MVYFDGFDVTKEIQYGYAVPDLAARGVGCLIVDGPGNGESVRFRNLPLIAETERYATPVYDYLAGRPEFDPKRIGVMALSLGGYYAPRAASLEPRYACCIAWGAQWDYHAIWKKRLEDLATGKVLSLSVPPEHLQWVLGVDSQAAALKVLEGFRLDGIVQKMRCPFLLLHGEGDEQISLSLAHTLLRRGRLQGEDAPGLHPRGGRLPPLPGRQHHHRRPHHVGLGVRRAQARAADPHEKRTARRDADRLGRADRDGRRRRAARRRVPSDRRRQASGDPELRALCAKASPSRKATRATGSA